MFKLIRVLPPHSSPYVVGYVEFDRRYTIGEFIEEALKNYPGVSGTFSIDATSLFVNYQEGNLLNKELTEKILSARIAAVSFYTESNKADYIIYKLEGQ